MGYLKLSKMYLNRTARFLRLQMDVDVSVILFRPKSKLGIFLSQWYRNWAWSVATILLVNGKKSLPWIGGGDVHSSLGLGQPKGAR